MCVSDVLWARSDAQCTARVQWLHPTDVCSSRSLASHWQVLTVMAAHYDQLAAVPRSQLQRALHKLLSRLIMATAGSSAGKSMKSIYRSLLRAVDKQITSISGNRQWRNFVAEQFRTGGDKHGRTDAIPAQLQLAHDYTFLINNIAHHKVGFSWASDDTCFGFQMR